MDIVNIYDNYNSYFNSELKELFKKCSKLAQKNSFKIFLIGGLVRDLLLNIKSLDIDITVEGNAIEFAKILEKEGAKITSIHEDFGTAKIEFMNQKIDLASTRSEIYPRKGHLPVIEKIGCTLKQDVSRRDFTINSLAMSLNDGTFADVVDYTNGLEDLKTKKIKILHEKSFIDDPTRIIRGLKYSSRLGFNLDKETEQMQKEYLKNINYDMCYKRVRQELKKTFNSCNNGTFYKFLNQEIYKLINPKFNLNDLKISFEELERSIQTHKPKQPWLVYLGIMTINTEIKKFELTKDESDTIKNANSLLNQKLSTDFEIYKNLENQKLETLLILSALGKEKEVSRFLKALQHIKLVVSGNDIIDLGFKPSKNFKNAFDFVLKEKLKAPELTKSQELNLIKTYFTNHQ